jgi:hypothetical protein
MVGGVVDRQTVAAAVLLIGVLAGIFYADKRCLDDLSQTPDGVLRYFPRGTWAMIIIFFFPLGPLMYLMYAKGPRA